MSDSPSLPVPARASRPIGSATRFDAAKLFFRASLCLARRASSTEGATPVRCWTSVSVLCWFPNMLPPLTSTVTVRAKCQRYVGCGDGALVGAGSAAASVRRGVSATTASASTLAKNATRSPTIQTADGRQLAPVRLPSPAIRRGIKRAPRCERGALGCCLFVRRSLPEAIITCFGSVHAARHVPRGRVRWLPDGPR